VPTRGLFAVLILLLGQEPEPTLDQVLSRMEEEARAFRGSTFEMRNARVRGSPWGPVADSTVAVARDGTVRVRTDPDRELTLAAGQLTIIEEHPQWRLGTAVLRRRAERLRPGVPMRIDAFMRPYPSYQYLDAGHALFHRLSPRAALALEPELRLSERRRAASDPYVLVSRPPGVGSIKTASLGGEEGFRVATKKFHVHPLDFKLERIEIRLVWGGRTEYLFTWAFDGWGDGRPGRLAGSIELSVNDVYYTRVDFEPAAVKREPDLDGVAIRPSERDLYATAARTGDAEARLRASPDDPDLHYSKFLEFLHTLGALPGGLASDTTTRMLEKAVEGSWTSNPVRNLLNVHANRKDWPALEALAARIEKDPRRPPEVAFDAAEAFIQLGKFDRALGLLAGLDALPKTRVAELRIAALLSLGETAKAVAEFTALAEPAWAERLAGLASLLPEEARKALPREELLKRLDEAVAADPKSAGLHAARLRALAQGEEIDRIPAAVRAALESSPGEEVHRAAYELVRAALQRSGPRLALEEEERADPWIPRLLDALGTCKDSVTASALRGAALKGAGRREEAAKEFAAALDALEKAEPTPRLAALAGDLATDTEPLGNDALLERAGRQYLRTVTALGKNPAGTQFSGRNPMQVYAQVCLRRGAHDELFRELRRIASIVGGGEPFLVIFNWSSEDIRTFLKTCRAEVLKEGGSVEDLKWIAQSVSTAERYGYVRVADFDLTELLESARDKAPRDLEVLQMLAARYAGAGQTALATKSCNEILAALAAGARCERPWSRDRARLIIAEQQHRRGNTAAALAAAQELDPAAADLASAELSRASQLVEDLGRLEAAVAFMGRLVEEGYRPYLRMATLHLRRRDWGEAMRHVNRAMDRGFDPDPGGAGTRPGRQELPPEVKARVYREAGEDWFLDRFFASKLPAMAPEERREAEGLYRRFLEDDIAVRDEATERLRKLGPKCAPVLRPGLELANAGDRARVRALLSEWAEPR
jgi:tetratricopeptide (TPR) repeat protein